tara:strand:+ start:746 stop:1204 length:459 start_codon:yes stop_codon:yes gene_type:complete
MKLFRSKSDGSRDPYDEFLASIKLVSGEEILSKVVVDYSNDREQVIIDNPVVCQEVRSSGANIPLGYKFEPWMKMSDEDVFVLTLDKVITLSEIRDKQVIDTYNAIIEDGFKRRHPEITKDMGYVNSVDKARDLIKKLYDGDSASKEPNKDL